MHLSFRYALLAYFGISTACLAVPQAQPPAPEPKTSDGPCLVEVRLADGSAVRMTLTQTHIDVVTRYGKLSVPVADIKRIDFGFRYPEGAKSRIDDAISMLGSAHFKDREAAAAELFGFKDLAYPALKAALKSSDAEVVKRAEEIIKKIEDKVPAERLKVSENDSIQTQDFTIVGRIESSTLKARSPYFGEVRVQLAEARNLRSLRQVNDVELTLETRFASHTEWLETEIELAADEPVEIKAAGTMLLRQGGGGYESTPNGNTNYRDGNFNPGQLLGRVGKLGKTFVVGEKYKGIPGEAGRLYLRVHPSPWGNQMSGSYGVRVTLGGNAEGRTTGPEIKKTTEEMKKVEEKRP